MARKIIMGRSLNLEDNVVTPTRQDTKCDYFYQRFIGWGKYNEKRAICDLDDPKIQCDYQDVKSDGTPLCMRYWYGPMYEIVQECDVPGLIQKRDKDGNLLFYEDDMTTMTIVKTDHPIMLEVSKERPIPYLENTAKFDTSGNKVYTHPEFYSTQYVDTHLKKYVFKGNDIDWYYDV
jgi:hypothetical protein